MTHHARSAALALLTLLASPVGADVALLHNGSLLEGTVERAPEVVIVRGAGSVIRVRPSEVAHVAATPVAAYEWLRNRAASTGQTASDHLMLADWALQNRLWPQAARELLDARQLAPGSRRLELLERRLDELIRPAPARPAPQTTPAAQPAIAEQAPAESLPRLPDDALEQFTRRIQPVLLNGCAATGCHGVDPAGGFELDLAPLRGYGDARSTERNLYAALAAIDLQQPADSRLLVAARGPHAGTTPIVGPRRDEILRRVTRWVTRIAAANAPPGAEDEPSEGATETAATPPTPRSAQPSPGESPNGATPSEAADEPDWRAIVDAEQQQPAELQRGARLQRRGQRDEFDPELFNTRYRRPQDDAPLSGGSLNGPSGR